MEDLPRKIFDQRGAARSDLAVSCRRSCRKVSVVKSFGSLTELLDL
jgi:hypothetical protein